MCRHLAYLGPPVSLSALLLEPTHGLYQQSWRPRRQRSGVVNADGFGIAWYPPEPDAAPARYRRTVPIWADGNLADIARTVRAGAVLAAVRDATEGTSRDEASVAPLRTGRWVFSHNGAVRDWTELPTETDLGLTAEDVLRVTARSDSGLLWAMIGQRLASGRPAAEAVAAVVTQIAGLRPDAGLNLMLSDGRTITATRWGDSLWYRTGPDSVLVASEPDDTDGWNEVPDHHVVTATTSEINLAPMRVTAA